MSLPQILIDGLIGSSRKVRDINTNSKIISQGLDSLFTGFKDVLELSISNSNELKIQAKEIEKLKKENAQLMKFIIGNATKNDAKLPTIVKNDKGKDKPN